MRILITCFLLAFMISSVAMAEECKDIDFTLDAEGIRSLELATGAGYLDITGASGTDNIEVHARACTDSRRRLDEMDVLYQRRGNAWVVETEVGNARDGFSVFSLSDFNSQARIEDGSGSITIRDIEGDVHIPDDGSGSIRIERVSGNVYYRDVDGRVDVRD